MRRLSLAFAGIVVVALVCGLAAVRLLDATPRAASSSRSSISHFVSSADQLCRPLTRLLSQSGRVSAAQLVIVRTEAEELSHVRVPFVEREDVNALLGAMADYAITYEQALGERVVSRATKASLDASVARVNTLFTRLDLHSCHL